MIDSAFLALWESRVTGRPDEEKWDLSTFPAPKITAHSLQLTRLT